MEIFDDNMIFILGITLTLIITEDGIMIMRMFILILVMKLVSCQGMFQAFDCDEPTEAKFFRHSDCNREGAIK